MPRPDDLSSLRRRLELGRLLSGSLAEMFIKAYGAGAALSVALSDVEVLLDGDEALATFTRRDVFLDRHSGKQVELEVRLSTVVVHKDGRWLMRGVKRS